MTSRLLVALAVALSAALVNPAESLAQRQRWPGGSATQQQSGGGERRAGGGGARQTDGGRRAQPRAAQPRREAGGGSVRARGEGRRASPPRESTPPPQVRSAAPESRSGSDDGRRAVRRFPTDADRSDGARGDRSIVRDDRGRYTGRVAVPRVGRPPRDYPRGYSVYRNYGGRNIYIVPRGRTYLYYPRYYYRPYTFGYGPAGRGHFYFDLHYNSYIWHPHYVYRYGTYGYYGYPVGELRLKVRPREAQVFVDGYYAGRVDDFDGIFQSLRLEEGEYQIEIVHPGYEPLAFDVRIFPGEKTTYEGDLIPEP